MPEYLSAREVNVMLISQAEALQTFNLTKPTLHRWVREGRLTEYRTVGGHRRYDKKELERLLKSKKSF